VTALRVGPVSAELRRALGPVAWFVLEELLLGDGEEAAGTFVARASARSLAAAVSLNKDTVAAHWRRLPAPAWSSSYRSRTTPAGSPAAATASPPVPVSPGSTTPHPAAKHQRALIDPLPHPVTHRRNSRSSTSLLSTTMHRPYPPYPRHHSPLTHLHHRCPAVPPDAHGTKT